RPSRFSNRRRAASKLNLARLLGRPGMPAKIVCRNGAPTPAPPPAPAAPLAVHVVHPNAVYTVAQAQAALGLRANSLKREIRQKRLRVARRCGRYYLLGEWILLWLRAGVVGAAE